jgi:benzoyl-CoA 2,3-dioxygenase component A
MNAPTPAEVLQQHLIDPEICIRCNTCEETCPVDAVTHDSRNYVVDPAKCNFCNACLPPCPTGSIDNWRTVLRSEAYTVAEQLEWDELPAPKVLDVPGDAAAGDAAPTTPPLRPTKHLRRTISSPDRRCRRGRPRIRT